MTSLTSNRLGLVAALAAVNLVLAAGGWLLLVSPQRHHAATAAQQATQLRAELVLLGNASSAGGKTPSAQQPRIQTADLYRLAQAMPSSLDETDMLLALDQLARGSGVRMLGVSPAAPTPAVGYDVVPVTLNLAAGYSSLTRFLHRLQGLVTVRHGKLVATGRLFSVNSVGLTPGQGREETATVSLNAYVFGAVAGVPPLSTDPTATDTTATGTTTGATTSATTSSGG